MSRSDTHDEPTIFDWADPLSFEEELGEEGARPDRNRRVRELTEYSRRRGIAKPLSRDTGEGQSGRSLSNSARRAA